MHFPRAAGLLLHPTSLPGRFGIGSLGHNAERFIELLSRCGMQLWQVLPLGPTGYGNSPYQSLSAFAGNPLLICLERLQQDGLLSEHDLANAPAFNARRVDFGVVIPFYAEMLKSAFGNFQHRDYPELQAEYEQFLHQQADWLPDYALFSALKKHFGGGPWTDWPKELVRRQKAAMQQWREKLAEQREAVSFQQFLFFRQWQAIKGRANEAGIRIIGDIPIFVAHDSADVWANQNRFHLNPDGQPKVVAGVPPDYFSETGQLWGNPLYRWQVMSRQNYTWWAARMKQTLHVMDIVRIDHFRGFEAYWEVAGDAENAIIGRWVKGPGAALFHALREQLGELPIIAEDLGVITPEVEALRDGFDFPGMKVLQFAFGSDSSNEYLPHNYPPNCVVYTGTHDNDTSIGWLGGNTHADYDQLGQEQQMALRYMGLLNSQDFHWAIIRLAFSSTASMAVIPLQDALGLGNEARMNVPGRADGNWEWRYVEESIPDWVIDRLADMVWLYGRQPQPA